MEWRLHTDDADAAIAARPAFMNFLHMSCADNSDFDSAEIAFGELVANVSRYAPGPITIQVNEEPYGCVSLHVLDSGPGFILKPQLPSVGSESGRGLYMISMLCRELKSKLTAEGHEVSVILPVTSFIENTRIQNVSHIAMA